jgi:fido (protein-threonine AMPylation protein)
MKKKLGLVPSWITLRHELNEVEQGNILEGERWAFSRDRNVLEEGFLRELHRRMFAQVWKWAWEYSRETHRRIGSDSFMISIDLSQLLGDANYWVENQTYPGRRNSDSLPQPAGVHPSFPKRERPARPARCRSAHHAAWRQALHMGPGKPHQSG